MPLALRRRSRLVSSHSRPICMVFAYETVVIFALGMGGPATSVATMVESLFEVAMNQVRQ